MEQCEESKLTTQSMKEMEQFTFSIFSSSDSTSMKDSSKKKSKKQSQLLIVEKFPRMDRQFHQKNVKTNPPTPKLNSKKSHQIELNSESNWQPVEEAFLEENILDKKKGLLGYSKLKMITDDKEFNRNQRGRGQSKLEDDQWKQRCKSLEALPQVEEEECEDQCLVAKKISTVCDKNEFNSRQLSRRMSINSNVQLFVESIHEDDELNESPQGKNIQHNQGVFCLANQKLKIDEIDKKKKVPTVSENDLEVLEESKEEEELICKLPQSLSKLRNEQKEFLQKIIRGEKLTTVDELLQVMEKEHLCQTLPIEELQEEDENYKKLL